jgi:hypothetical protein
MTIGSSFCALRGNVRGADEASWTGQAGRCIAFYLLLSLF